LNCQELAAQQPLRPINWCSRLLKMTRAGCLGGLVTNLRFQEEGNRMPRRSILSAAERESLLALPDTKDELIRHYTFSESDLSIIRQRRGPANRLGFAVQLCYLRFPGVILGADEPPFPPLLRLVANQLKVGIESWDEYGQREQTRREHLVELQTVFGFQPFTIGHYRQAVQLLTELAMQTDKGIVLARALIEHLRRQSVIVPALNAVERASAEAITRAVFFNRLGEIRDRSFEQQRYRASGLNLVTAAIVLWNTVYLERAANALRGHGQAVDDGLLQYLSPLGWEHINLTGDYLWRSSAKIGAGKFRPLRPLQPA